jgi:aerobic carbon-monoxide dehydrogenase medium subunit
VKPPPFRYYDPTTVADAIALLSEKENVKLLAGGQSLMPMLNMRYVQPDHVIDLNKVSELAYVREAAGSVLIGAMTRQRDLEFSERIRQKLPLMHEALLSVGHRQTRNRGTIGGSLCHLDPAAELPAIMMAYDGVLEVRGGSGIRTIPISEFPAGFMSPAIAADEMVTSLSVRPWPAGHGSAFVEFSRRRGDFAMVSVAVLLDFHGDVIRRASITVGGLSYAPRRVPEAEERLRKGAANESDFREAAEICGALEANGDIHGSAAYRQQLARVLAFRALTIAHERGALSRRGQRA